MRLTYAIVLELSLDKSLPGFFESIGQYPCAQGIDRLTVLRRREIERLEFENVQLADEPKCRQVAEVAGEWIADYYLASQRFSETAGDAHGVDMPNPAWDWRDYGRVTVQLVEDAKNPEWTHGMAGENPAVLCPKCDKPMIRRQGHGSPFWGCSNYPTCRGTRQISK